MRVAYVCADPGVPVFGCKGASVHVQEVVRALRRRGASVELFATRAGGEPPADLADVACHPLPPVGKGPVAARERAAVRANAGLRAQLAAAESAGGGFDLVYERYSLWSVAGMAHARRRGVPGVLEVNAPLIDEQRDHRGLVHAASARRCAAAAFGTARSVVAVSPPVAEWAVRHGAPPARVTVVPNGVDPARFAWPRPPRGEGFTAGFVGTLKPWHGVDVVIDAVAALVAAGDDVRLLVVGDGPERAALQRQAEARHVAARVEWTGTVDPAAVPGLLARMDVGCAPYRDQPGFYFSPLKVYEYLAAGLPVVAGRVGAIEEIVEHGRTGLLHRPGHAGELADALAALLAHPARREAMGSAGRAAVAAHHTWDAVAGRILAATGLPGGPADGRAA